MELKSKTRPVGDEQRKAGATDPVADNSKQKPETDIQTCCGYTEEGRNLVLCIDGTANQFGDKNTNVIELYNLVVKGPVRNSKKQLTWYNSGIGTYARPSWKSIKYLKKVFNHKVDLAIAWDFERTVLAAYKWLSDNYEPGDCIFLFGFSRGAFQVRVLSAMIDKVRTDVPYIYMTIPNPMQVGLIYKGNEMQIPFAFELYADPKSDEQKVAEVGADQSVSSAERFKKAFSYEGVKVHFVGAWDTVSSIGIARGQNMLPRTVDGMKHVCYFRHALALDERRVKFLPEYAYGGSTLKPPQENANSVTRCTWKFWKWFSTPSSNSFNAAGHDHNTTCPDTSNDGAQNSEKKSPHTLEVWFAGTHSDIGGGNVQNLGMNRSRPPLRWMVFEAGKLGLRTAQFQRELTENEQIQIKESLTYVWKILEILPLKRLTYTRRNGNKYTHKPHLGASRKIHDGQKIHSSLVLAGKQSYIPKARPIGDDTHFWEDARENGLGEWQELDLYSYADDLAKRFVVNLDKNLLRELQQTASWVDGRQAVCESLYSKLINALQDTNYDLAMKWRLLTDAGEILETSPLDLKETHSAGICALILSLLPTIDITVAHWKSVKQFLDRFPNVYGQKAVYQSLYSKVVNILQNSDYDLEMKWQSLTNAGEILKTSPLELKATHSAEIYTLMLPLLSAMDTTAAQQKSAKEFLHRCTNCCLFVLHGHTSVVTSVAISPNGKLIASGSGDETIQIWSSETGVQVREALKGHTKSVRSVTFSSDGTRIVSGSYDSTIRLWDSTTGEQIGAPFQGHTGSVVSVAFSPDSTRVVSGSVDKTVRIWDCETGEQIGKPLAGHTGGVYSIAFSPDGMRIVSGSDDYTIRLWGSQMGAQIGQPFTGHGWFVTSVAFSPDGKRIVSGSSDETIRVWDAGTGKQVGEPFQGHTKWVNCVAFSPDGRRVVSGSSDETVRIWDVETGKQVGEPLRGHTDEVSSVAFLPDGKHVVSGSDDKTVRIWDVEMYMDAD